MGELISIDKFTKMEDLRVFASELESEWEQEKLYTIDRDNKWWTDEIEFEFFEAAIARAGLESWESDYVLYKLGY